jgi:hypothetical protein
LHPPAALPEASPKDHGEGRPETDTLTVSSRSTPRNKNTGKTSPLTHNDADQPRHAHGYVAEQVISIRSVHSARAVRTNLSAIAFIRGACGAVGTTSIPQAVNTASNAAVNLESRSRIRW